MAKTFYDLWTAAKVKFEYAAGKKLERQNNIHKRQGKDGREAETRMKKPTKGTFRRNKVGIGEAAKGLDKALLQTGGWEKKRAALKTFTDKAKAYAQQLDEAKDGDYESVKVEIAALKKDMIDIEARFSHLTTDLIALDLVIGAGTLPEKWVDLEAAFDKESGNRKVRIVASKQYAIESASLAGLKTRISDVMPSQVKLRNSLIVFQSQFVTKIKNVVDNATVEWVEKQRARVALDLFSFAKILVSSDLDEPGLLAKIKNEEKRFKVYLTRRHHNKEINVPMVDGEKCRDLCKGGVGDLIDSLGKWAKGVDATLVKKKALVERLEKIAGE